VRRPGNRTSNLSEIAGVASDHSLGIFPGGFSRPPKGKRRRHETADQPLARCSGNPPGEREEGLNFWGRRVGTGAVVVVGPVVQIGPESTPMGVSAGPKFIGDDKWTDLRKRKWSPI